GLGVLPGLLPRGQAHEVLHRLGRGAAVQLHHDRALGGVEGRVEVLALTGQLSHCHASIFSFVVRYCGQVAAREGSGCPCARRPPSAASLKCIVGRETRCGYSVLGAGFFAASAPLAAGAFFRPLAAGALGAVSLKVMLRITTSSTGLSRAARSTRLMASTTG